MRFLDALYDLYALREFPGAADNPEVVKLYADAGHPEVKHDSVAWCAAAANAILFRSGYPTTGKLSAKSFLGIGERISMFNPPGYDPSYVDIVLFYRGRPWSDEDPEHFESGHVAFPLKERDGYIYCLGGNQADQFKVSAYLLERKEQYRRIYRNAQG